MTAINVITQRDSVHIASDSAIYTADGVVHQFAPKIRPVHHWPGAIAGRGSALAMALLSEELANVYPTFDSTVAGVSDDLRGIVARLDLSSVDVDLFLVGWSAKRHRAEAYTIRTSEALPLNCSEEQSAASIAAGFTPSKPFELLALPAVVMGPAPENAVVVESFYKGFNLESDPADIVLELRRVLQMQRQEAHGGVHWCGGYGQAVTVSASGVTEQRLQTWPDLAGERLKTLPIEWLVWCMENGMKPTLEQVAVRDQIRAIEKVLAECVAVKQAQSGRMS